MPVPRDRADRRRAAR